MSESIEQSDTEWHDDENGGWMQWRINPDNPRQTDMRPDPYWVEHKIPIASTGWLPPANERKALWPLMYEENPIILTSPANPRKTS